MYVIAAPLCQEFLLEIPLTTARGGWSQLTLSSTVASALLRELVVSTSDG